MGDKEATPDPSDSSPVASGAAAIAPEETPSRSGRVEPVPPSSQHFPGASVSPTPSDGQVVPRRSSIRPAPASFKPTLRDNSKLPPPMIIHSGEVDVAPVLPSQPSSIKLDKPLRNEPFALADDLHQATLPLEIPPPGGVPRDLVYRNERLPSFDMEEDGCDRSPAADASAAVEGIQVVPPAEVDEEAVTLMRNERPSVRAPRTGSAEDAPVADAFSRASQPDAGSGIRSVEVTVPEAKRTRRWVPIAVAAAVLGLGVAVFVGQRHEAGTPDNVQGQPSAQAIAPPVALAPVEPAKVPSVADTWATAAPIASAIAPAVGDGDLKRVTVMVRQADAKVVMRGAAVAGPPFIVEVPKGKKVSLEISKKGYATRKLTVDGKRSTEVVGLVAAK